MNSKSARGWRSEVGLSCEVGVSFQVRMTLGSRLEFLKWAWVLEAVWPRLPSQCGVQNLTSDYCQSRVECVRILVGLVFHKSRGQSTRTWR